MKLWLGFSVLGLVACGGSSDSTLFADSGRDGTTTTPDGDVFDAAVDQAVVDMGPSCDNLECQIEKCDSGTTTLSGVVTTPNGLYPVYNAAVYIPNAMTAPIPDGIACESCQAPLSGKPLVSGQLGVVVTDAKGQFQLKDVPVGSSIPIVVQIGKWRRESKINVNRCVDNTASKDLVRLPKNSQEGHLPKIAVQVGQCENLACALVNGIGIDPAEFTPNNGNGRVHTFNGNGGGTAPANSTDAYALWGNLGELTKYDLVMAGCECAPYARDTMGPAYDNLKKYVDGGGRFVGSHYHYNWFATSSQCSGDPTCKGPTEFNNVAKWGPNQGFPPVNVEQGHPRGSAFATWAVDRMISPMLGTVTLDGNQLRNDVGGLTADATRWLYAGGGVESTYFTFNTPIGGMKKCGRVAFSDMHVRGIVNTIWPTSCTAAQQIPNNEIAFTFLFFDLFGCAQDDTKAPITPPTQ